MIPIRRLQSGFIALAAAALGPLAAVAIMVTLRSSVANTSLALIMVVVVVVCVIPGRRPAAVVAGLSAGLWFDFFLTKPYESFSIHSHTDIETTVLLIVVAVSVGEISARRRHRYTETVIANYEISRIHAITEMLASGASSRHVVEAIAAELEGLLSLLSCRYDANLAAGSGPFIDRTGTLQYGQLLWDVTTDGLPNREVTLVIEGQGRPLGRYVLQGPKLGVPLAAVRLVVAVALSDLAGAALAAEGTLTPGGAPLL